MLAVFSIDDIESAGLLAGFLGEKFYDFTKLVEDECFKKKSDCD
uniref:YslB protein n=1 Tax=Podoviridae sp. ctz6O13 TaxID=2827757 RepID=A0A8S5TKY9_9CAUD|nr:MAG TPA: YslB protein [Podoviridae sp. ctz6O13]